MVLSSNIKRVNKTPPQKLSFLEPGFRILNQILPSFNATGRLNFFINENIRTRETKPKNTPKKTTANYIIFTICLRLLALKLVYGCYFDGGELQQTLDKGTFKIHSYNITIQQNH